jgi:hypothetical protein
MGKIKGEETDLCVMNSCEVVEEAAFLELLTLTVGI